MATPFKRHRQFSIVSLSISHIFDTYHTMNSFMSDLYFRVFLLTVEDKLKITNRKFRVCLFLLLFGVVVSKGCFFYIVLLYVMLLLMIYNDEEFKLEI